MSKLGRREKILLFVLGFVILVYSFYSFYLVPELDKINNVKGSINAYEKQIEQINQAKKINSKLKTELLALIITTKDVFLTIPEMERNPEIAYNIKQLSDQNITQLHSLSFDQISQYNDIPPSNEEKSTTEKTVINYGIYKVPIAISISGNYETLMEFLASVENHKRISSIKSLTITSNEKELDANINIDFYYSNRISTTELDYEFNDGRIDGKINLFE